LPTDLDVEQARTQQATDRLDILIGRWAAGGSSRGRQTRSRRRSEGRKQFFFEKKNQKTFVPGRTLPDRSATATQKSFASFLQKRRLAFVFAMI